MKKDDVAFVYVGDGLGVPGLPHYVTREQAEKLGHLDHLEAAIARGDYRPEKPAPKAAIKPETEGED